MNCIKMFFMAMLLGGLFSCSKPTILDSPPLYKIEVLVKFLNVGKDTERIKIKLSPVNKNQNNIFFGISSVEYSHSISNKDSEVIIKKNNERNLNGFRLIFLPYDDTPEEIGKEREYRLEVYKNSTLFLEKMIRIQADHIYPEGDDRRHNWLLKASKFEVESMDYVKKIEDFRLFILIEK